MTPDPNGPEGDRFIEWWQKQGVNNLGPAHRMTAWNAWVARASLSEAEQRLPTVRHQSCHDTCQRAVHMMKAHFATDAVERDAARYRFIRDCDSDTFDDLLLGAHRGGEFTDAAIDAAMQSSRSEESK